MKKILLLMLGAIVALTSCQKDLDLEANGSSGEMVSVTVSAVMEGTSATTRAIDSYGTGSEIDRCIMEVYSNGELYKRVIETPNDPNTDGTRSVTFDLRLVSSQEYNFLFWADYSGSTVSDDVYAGDNYYTTTDGLEKITADYSAYVGNDEKRDAFFGNILGETITSSIVLDVILKRPFGQLNVSTLLTDVPESMYPKYVSVEYTTTVANTLNVSTEETSGEKTIKWSDMPEAIDSAIDNETKLMHLSTDYIFAPYYGEEEVKQQLVDFVMSFYSNATDQTPITTNDNFINIPIQRNYRTNVSGELLTKQGTINVTIDPTFYTPDINITIKEVADASALQDELDSDVDEVNTSYSVVDTVDDGTTIIINSIATAEATTVGDETTSRSIEFTGGIDGEVTIEYASDADSAGETPDIINITIDTSTTGTINLNVPYSTVYVNGELTEANVWTAEDTFVVQEGSTIDTLTIKGGNVEIYGTVGKIVIADTNEEYGTITIFSSDSLTTTPDASELKNYTISFDITVEIEVQEAGTLEATLEAANIDISTVTSLILSGALNSDDCQYIRTYATYLQVLDLTETSVSGSLTNTGADQDNTIGIYAFKGLVDYPTYRLQNLVKICLPKDVEVIATHAFGVLRSLETIVFPEESKLTTLNAYCFGGCGSLKEVILPMSVTTLENAVFAAHCNATSGSGSDSSFERLVAPGVTTVGSSLFSESPTYAPGTHTSLKELVFSSEITVLNNYFLQTTYDYYASPQRAYIDTETIDITLNANQSDVDFDNNTWTFGGKTYTFKSITVAE